MTGASMLGTKTVLLTDHPALYVHDTGGLLGEAHVSKAEPFAFDDRHLYLADGSSTLRGQWRFGRRMVTFSVDQSVAKVTASLAEHVESEAAFDSRIPLSVQCRFESDSDALVAEVEVTCPELPGNRAELDRVRLAGTLPADVLALASHLVLREFPARVVVDGGRLLLKSRDADLADLPLAHVELRQQGRSVIITTTAVVAGQSATKTTIWFASKADVKTFLDALPEQASATAAAVEGVDVDGRGPDGVVSGRFDALLSDDGFELRGLNDESLHRFVFDDPELRIAGTSSAFLIADASVGPLRVTIANQRFQRRVSDHVVVRECAARSQRVQPFVVLIDDAPASVSIDGDRVSIVGADAERQVKCEDIERIEVRGATVQLAIAGEDHRLTGDIVLLQSLHTALHAQLLLARTTTRQDVVMATLGREGDYLLYSVFGPFYELHAALCREWGRGDQLHALELPKDLDKQLAMASVIADAAERLLRHLDMVAHYLPSFLVRCDAAVFPAGQAPMLKQYEAGYRNTLGTARALCGELSGMRELLLRIDGVKPLPAGTGLASMSLAVAAAGVLSPLFLISGVDRALGASRHSKQQKERHGEVASASLQRALDKWNYWIEKLLPAFSHQLIESVFPLRCEVGKRLAEVADGVEPAIARRLATLEVFFQYPDEAGGAHSRGEIVRAIRAARERFRYPGFQSF